MVGIWGAVVSERGVVRLVRWGIGLIWRLGLEEDEVNRLKSV